MLICGFGYILLFMYINFFVSCSWAHGPFCALAPMYIILVTVLPFKNKRFDVYASLTECSFLTFSSMTYHL
jgi:hypothetical protein